MKKQVCLLFLCFLFLLGCGGIKTTTKGLENQSFLVFVGPVSSYSGGVDVVVDNKTNFKATVIKDKVSYMKGEVYAISTGNHNLKVSFHGKLLYDKQIFVAAQETKKIVLQ